MRHPCKNRSKHGRWRWILLAVIAVLCAAGIYALAGPWVRIVVVWLAVSATITVVTTILTALVLIQMPADYFSDHRPREFWPDKHVIIRWAGRIVKNLLGVSLVVTGIVMTIPGVPGPGLLTVVFGIMLLDFPGKRRLERWMVCQPIVLTALNRLRRRYGKPPMVVETIMPGDDVS
jgi:hypothetical protein